MFSRLRAALIVVLLLAILGGLPATVPRAHAEPRAVTVATYDIEPFVLTEGNVKYGFTIDLLDEIAKRTGWTYTYTEGGTVSGLLKAVADGRVDLAAANISITAEREKRFNFSQPIIAAGLQIAVPASTRTRLATSPTPPNLCWYDQRSHLPNPPTVWLSLVSRAIPGWLAMASRNLFSSRSMPRLPRTGP